MSTDYFMVNDDLKIYTYAWARQVWGTGNPAPIEIFRFMWLCVHKDYSDFRIVEESEIEGLDDLGYINIDLRRFTASRFWNQDLKDFDLTSYMSGLGVHDTFEHLQELLHPCKS